jgi:hypothetical protein
MEPESPGGDPLRSLLERWTLEATVPPPPLVKRSQLNRSRMQLSSPALAMVLVAVVGILGLRAWASSTGSTNVPTTTGSPGGTPSATLPGVATASPEAFASPIASTSPTSQPTPSPDPTAALALAKTWERARATGNWTKAWDLLSPYSQAVIGTEADFAQQEAAYNRQGGSTYTVEAPSRDPGFLSQDWLGNVYLDVQATADLDQAWIVSVLHPKFPAASAGTVMLVVAPSKDGHWEIWIGH